MKLFILLLSLLSITGIFAQNNTRNSTLPNLKNSTPPSKPKQENNNAYYKMREAKEAYIKNKEITIEGLAFDSRVLRHYTEETLKSFTSTKRRQINFIYTESYTIKNPNNCKLTAKDIDVAAIEIYRKEDEENIIEYGNECKVQVVLMPRSLYVKKIKELEQ